MAVQITPRELSEIVTGLLLKPELMGHLDDYEQHSEFFLAIGEVIADFCGGEINWVNNEDKPYTPIDDQLCPTISVSANDNLPSLHSNIWTLYDSTGWSAVNAAAIGIPFGEPHSPSAVSSLRKEIQTLLSELAMSEAKD